MIPRATYRLQFHRGFTFADAAPLASYFARLGISHVYASPIGAARAGSAHGYDQVDPTRINPELGGEAGFRTLVSALRAEGLGVILDIVPNHMAVGGDDNPWWLDVLENGQESEYAHVFDIDWDPPDPALKGKLLAPFLGSSYAEALADGALKLERDPSSGSLAVIAYGTHRFPIRPEDRPGVADLELYDPASPDGRSCLHALLERQHYRLAWWRLAGDEINWRRFFDITELAGLQIEQREVFDRVHALPLRLYGEGLIDGVRVDHVDGLADPGGYCRTLRQALEAAGDSRPPEAAPGPAYLVVEKILAHGERLPPDWLTDGTSGYDYMNEAAALLHDPQGEASLAAAWADISGRSADFEAEERLARAQMLDWSFAGQLQSAARAFHDVARSDLSTRDFSEAGLRRALAALLTAFRAYRTYSRAEGVPGADADRIGSAVKEASGLVGPGEAAVVERVAAWIAGEGPGDIEARRDAVRKFQQLSAPVAAKAVEDTAFYRYGRLLSRNDVGSDPGRLSASIEAFHEANLERAQAFPHALLATATHDHKRGEDVRARLAVLSERPERWRDHVLRARVLETAGEAGVHPADAYQAHQMLVGAWPTDLQPDDGASLKRFADRLCGWMRKALREGKLRSSWAAPDEGYETACLDWLRAMTDPQRSTDVLAKVAGFVNEIAPAGALNGLVQTLLRCTAPGVPDLYQGTEFWDFSLVDPDNRRPVDFDARRSSLESAPAPTSVLLGDWRDGRVKQAVIAAALQLRRSAPPLFEDGNYEPLQTTGLRAGHVLAFARSAGDDTVLVAVPLRCAAGVGAEPRLPPGWWGDTCIQTPAALSGRNLRNALSAEAVAMAPQLRVDDLFGAFPSALLSTVEPPRPATG